MSGRKGCGGRPIGLRIREVLEVLDRIGPARSGQVIPHMGNTSAKDDPGSYMKRAVALGLAKKVEDYPATYQVVPDWRKKLERHGEKTPESVSYRGQASSVWDYAQRSA
jgi:hypothetical protein